MPLFPDVIALCLVNFCVGAGIVSGAWFAWIVRQEKRLQQIRGGSEL